MKKIIAGYSHGKGIKNITSVKVLKNIKIPVPKKDIQTKIIENAERIQSEINNMKAELEKNENTDLLKNFLSSKNQ